MRSRFTAFAAISSLSLSLGLMACGSSPTGPGDAAESASLNSPASGDPGYTPADAGLAEMAASDVGSMTSPSGSVAPAASSQGPAGALVFSDLDSENSACWDDRGASGYTRSACGPWSAIGSSGATLAPGRGRNGSTAMQVTFKRNEEVAGASLPVSSDIVNVRAYYNFSEGFDFGQGVKVGRISSFNEATQSNDIDMVMTVRSPQGRNQCGLTDMADLGIFFNGKPRGFDWGSIGAAVPFQRGRWYAVEYQVKLNAPGSKDGWVKLWVDGNLVASKESLNLRGSAGSNVKLNRLRIGGWYSNGAHGNSACASPSQASTVHIDDVAVGTSFLGTN